MLKIGHKIFTSLILIIVLYLTCLLYVTLTFVGANFVNIPIQTIFRVKFVNIYCCRLVDNGKVIEMQEPAKLIIGILYVTEIHHNLSSIFH